MSVIIEACNLRKDFRRQIPGEARYGTLRDGLANGVKNLFTKGRLPKREQEFFSALKDISFEVNQGDIIGLIGRNGAGKSTLLKILSQISLPTSGEVTMHGRVGSLLEVGTGFHPELSGRENVFMNGAILGMSREEIQKKFDDIIEFSGVGDFIDTPVKHYSSGMKARLAFSVAAHLDPEILIIDEVLAVGDYEFQKKCLGAIKDVAKTGRTILFVSHNMNIIRQLCNRGIYLRDGTIYKDSYDIDAVVAEYMSIESDARTYWDADEDSYDAKDFIFKPKKLYLSIDSQIIKRPIAGDEDVEVNINFEMMEVEKALSVGYALFDSMGALLYWTYTTDASGERVQIVKGKNTLSSKLPVNFLNDGDYRLVMIAGVQNDRPIYKLDTSPIGITISIQGHRDRSNFWTNRRHSIVAPVINWHANEEN